MIAIDNLLKINLTIAHYRIAVITDVSGLTCKRGERVYLVLLAI